MSDSERPEPSVAAVDTEPSHRQGIRRTVTIGSRVHGRGPGLQARNAELAELRAETERLLDGVDAERPRVRGDCVGGERPCPWVSCKHHMYLEVNPQNGSLRLNFPDREPWELEHSCALDVADAGEHHLKEIAALMHVSKQRIQQLEGKGIRHLRDGLRRRSP